MGYWTPSTFSSTYNSILELNGAIKGMHNLKMETNIFLQKQKLAQW